MGNILGGKLQYSSSQDIKENVYKIIYGWHLSPDKLCEIYGKGQNNCWKCDKEKGAFFTFGGKVRSSGK